MLVWQIFLFFARATLPPPLPPIQALVQQRAASELECAAAKATGEAEAAARWQSRVSLLRKQLADSRRRLQRAQEGEAASQARLLAAQRELARDQSLLAEVHRALTADRTVLQQASEELAAELVMLRKQPTVVQQHLQQAKAALRSAQAGRCGRGSGCGSRNDSPASPARVADGCEGGRPGSSATSDGGGGDASPGSPLSPRIAAGFAAD